MYQQLGLGMREGGREGDGKGRAGMGMEGRGRERGGKERKERGRGIFRALKPELWLQSSGK